MLEVAGELTYRGVDLQMSSSGEVADLLTRRGYLCHSLPLADVRYSESGEFALKETMLDWPSILARTYQQILQEVANIHRFRPDAVLSDSALSTVLAARILRLPIFTVLNQLNLTSSHVGEGAGSRLLSTGISAGMGKLWEFSDEVLLPDLPPPYTISEKNLWGSNVEKTRYIGFLIPTESAKPDMAALDFSGTSRPKIFWQVSGPPRTRAIFLKAALRAAEALSGRYSFVVTGGSPSLGTHPNRIPGGWYYGWCEIAEYYFRTSDVVVSRAGHGTIGQAITSSKPSLLVPIPRQPEQEGNAEKAVRLGVSLRLSQDDLSVERLQESIEALLTGGFDEKVKALGETARRFDAKEEIVKTIEASASGGRRAPGQR
jgi:UDP:flavonoid glycosyltransferase YjiC (YdhE family)